MALVTQKLIYKIEAVVVVLPSSLFILAMFPWLFAVPELSLWIGLSMLLLWIGGLLGVIALWQMFADILSGQKKKSKFLWIQLLLGMLAAAAPIAYAYQFPSDRVRDRFLLFLCPIFVGVHWCWVLNATRRNAVRLNP